MKTVVISLGGSLIVPDDIDMTFLKKFRKVILDFAKNNKVVMVCGGGATNKKYNKAANKIARISNLDLDWLGIAATEPNAELLRVIFSGHAVKKSLKDLKTNKKIIIGRGFSPGHSSDYDAVFLARKFKADFVINMTNVDYVYNKDPKYKDAKKIKEISWKDYLKIVGKKWSPRLNTPFDPVASQFAKKSKIKAVIIGKNINNLKNVLYGKKFNGTLIR